MSQVDASIPLSGLIPRFQPPGESLSLQTLSQRAQEQPYRMRELQLKTQADTMSLQEMQRDMEEQQKARQLAQQPGMKDPVTGMPTLQYINAVGGISPKLRDVAVKVRQDFYAKEAETKWKNAETQWKLGQIDKDTAETLRDVHKKQTKAYVDAYDKVKSSGGSDDEAGQAADTAYLDQYQFAKNAGLLSSISPEQQQAVMARPRDIYQMRGFLAAESAVAKEKTPSEYEDILARMQKLDPKSREYKQLEERRKYMTEHPPQIQVMQTGSGQPVTVEPVRGGEAKVRPIKMPGEGESLMKMGQQPPMVFTPAALQSAGAQAKSGQPLNQVVPGYGSGVAKQREQARQEAIRQIKEDNPGISDQAAGQRLAQASIDFVAGKRSITQLQTMLGATKQAIGQLEFNINKTKEVLQKLPSSDLSPIFNAIIRGEEKWTGDPRYSEAFYYMAATAQESARILQGGQASVAQLHTGAAEEARKWANINMTPKSFIEGVAPAMLEEGRARLKTYQNAIQSQSIGSKADESSGAITKPYNPSGTQGLQYEDPDKEKRYQEWKKQHGG